VGFFLLRIDVCKFSRQINLLVNNRLFYIYTGNVKSKKDFLLSLTPTHWTIILEEP